MYSSQVTPVQRMRNGGRRQSSGRGVSPSPKRRSVNSSVGGPSSGILGTTNRLNGDYQVLHKKVDLARHAVQDARISLASTLDQLGEHHVRQKEYDDAMDAFTESLREKRSVFWHMTQSWTSSTAHSRSTSSFNSSLLSRASGATMGDEDESTTFSNKDPAKSEWMQDVHDTAIDQLVNTLRSMGNVHSLRGEQDEAMRYFSEVTSLRAQKSSHLVSSDSMEARSLLSGLNDENSALMSEINEDVKALDDLFRSISFRNNTNSGDQTNHATRSAAMDLSDAPVVAEKRKRKTNSHGHRDSRLSHREFISTSNGSSKRQSGSATSSASESPQFVENEPFKRSTSSLLPPASGNEASEALEMYRSAIDSYSGHGVAQHKEMMNSLALRVDLLNENLRKAIGGTERHPHLLQSAETMYPDGMSSKAADLELALEIYQYVLVAHQESGSSLLSSSASNTSLASSSTCPHSPTSQQSQGASSSTASKVTSSADIVGNSTSNVTASNISGQTGSTPVATINAAQHDSSLLTLVHPSSPRSQSQSVNVESDVVSQQHHQQVVSSNIASTLICMGGIYYKLGNRVEELRMYQEAKRVYRKAFGENHAFVAGTRKNIGMVLAERGEYDAAMVQFEKAMLIYLACNINTTTADESRSTGSVGNSSKTTSPMPENNDQMLNRDVASAISCMGNVKNRIGELDAALSKYMQALDIYKSLYHQALSAEIPTDCSVSAVAFSALSTEALRDVTSTLKVIGMVHAKKGDLDTAMSFFQEAMALLRTMDVNSSSSSDVAGASNVDVANKVSGNISHSGDNSPAAAVVRETKASVLTRIASIHMKQGDLDAAMSHYRQAYDLTIRNRNGTTNHPEVAGILHYIGGIYHKRADYDEAMACYQESIRIYHATLGPGNPTVAGTLVMVGSIHYKRRHLDSAMMFYKEALRLNRDAYGMHHPDVAPILKSIGTILTKKGEYQEAYDVFRDVLSIKCTVHGTDHPEVASAYKSLGNVHYKLGDLADAERQYRHALSIYRRCKGEDHADTVAAKTTIEHLRYWMREREHRRSLEQRQSKSSGRSSTGGAAAADMNDERSC